MSETSSPRDPDTSLSRDLLDLARFYLRGWRGIAALATVAIGAGLALNWSWLVAVGIAPLLLTALPCLAMCALGLCMNRIGGRPCSTNTSEPPRPQERVVDAAAPPARSGLTATSIANGSDPEAAVGVPAPANANSTSEQERRLTDA